jgi:hypothetical protein
MLTAVVTTLAFAGAAHAGCWATAGISPLPTAVEAGQVWRVDVTVLQHGRTPMPDAKPAVVITSATSGESRTIAARPTSSVGIYRADVAFPSGGSWDVAVKDGFPVPECAATHTFGSFTIGGEGSTPAAPGPEPAAAALPAEPPPAAAVPVSTGDGGSSALWPILGGVGGALALAVLAAVAMRAREPRAIRG